MSKAAIVVIELPLDNGTQEDAETLAALIARLALSENGEKFKPMGRVIDVYLEEKRQGTLGYARAVATIRKQSEANG